MGLATDLGYQHARANAARRTFRWVGGTRAGGWVFSRTLRHLDKVVASLSRGRHSAPGLLAGLAVLQVTTRGRKSGQRRTSHLIATPYGETLALLGTNFGQAGTPAWVLNLEADPRATVAYRGVEVEALARPATESETIEIFEIASGFYPGYGHYRQRVAGNRRIRAFVLETA